MHSQTGRLFNYLLCSSFDDSLIIERSERNSFVCDSSPKSTMKSPERSSKRSSVKSPKRPSQRSFERSSLNPTAKPVPKTTMQSSISQSSYHHNVYSNDHRFKTVHSLLFIISSLLFIANGVDCNSAPKIMPFHFNPQQVQEGQKALASK